MECCGRRRLTYFLNLTITSHKWTKTQGILVCILVVLDFLFGLRTGTINCASSFTFQSLLCWISFLDLVWNTGLSLIMKFQSLLCWISFLDDYQSKILYMEPYRFQSLLCWISFLDQEEWKGSDVTLLNVSILVVLDFLFGPKKR